MELSSDAATRLTQLQTIKQYVIANHNGVFNQSTVNAMNKAAVPQFVLWKSSVSLAVVGEHIDGEEQGNLTSADTQRLVGWFSTRLAGVMPAKADHRAFFDDVFSAAGGVKTRAKLNGSGVGDDGLWRREALVGESILVSAGNGTNGDPGTLGDGAEGDITLNNLIEADGVTLP